MKILIIEDEQKLVDNIINYLKSESYICEVAADVERALEKIKLYTYDCILLDISLPDGNGLTILRTLKNQGKTEGVIIISAKGSLDDKVEGLELGADDYLAKPFHLPELGARIKAVTRRNKFDRLTQLVLNELTIDLQGKSAMVKGQPLDLTKSEFDLLLFLVSNKNKVVSKNAIAEHMSGDDADLFDNFDFVYSHIKNLKKKMAEVGCAEYIKTAYGFGYKFEMIT